MDIEKIDSAKGDGVLPLVSVCVSSVVCCSFPSFVVFLSFLFITLLLLLSRACGG